MGIFTSFCKFLGKRGEVLTLEISAEEIRPTSRESGVQKIGAGQLLKIGHNLLFVRQSPP